MDNYSTSRMIQALQDMAGSLAILARNNERPELTKIKARLKVIHILAPVAHQYDAEYGLDNLSDTEAVEQYMPGILDALVSLVIGEEV